MIGLLPRLLASFGAIAVLGMALAFAWPRAPAPPCPGAAVASARPLTLAATRRTEALSEDTIYALELRCVDQGAEPYTKAEYVACACTVNSPLGCRDWFYGVNDVPDRLRWASR